MKIKLSIICLLIFVSATFSQNVIIPDANFKAVLIQKGVDKNGDGEIQKTEALQVDSLSLFTNSITSIIGIEDFTNLFYFSTQMNYIGSVDFTKNKSLTYLDCSYTAITSIDLSQNLNLKTLLCVFNNKLQSLDLKANIHLEKIYLAYSNVSTIDLSQNINLKDMNFSYNLFSNIDISKNLNLERLNCNNNKLKSLDIRLNNNLIFLDCTYNNALPEICINSAQQVLISTNHSNWNKDSNSSWSTNCTTSIWEMESINKLTKVLKIYNTVGQEIMPDKLSEGVYILQYSDGSFKKIFRFENNQ